jgi:hypothetical protein
MSKTEILGIIKMLAAAYPRFALTEDTIKTYILLLSDIEPETLRAAAIECASKNAFFPSVAELRRAAANLHRRGNRVPSPDEAWGEMLNAPASGYTSQVTDERDEQGRVIVLVQEHQFTHDMIRKVAENLGWPKRFWTDSLMSDRSRFMTTYEATINRGLDDFETVPAVREYTDRLEIMRQERRAALDRGE